MFEEISSEAIYRLSGMFLPAIGDVYEKYCVGRKYLQLLYGSPETSLLEVVMDTTFVTCRLRFFYRLSGMFEDLSTAF